MKKRDYIYFLFVLISFTYSNIVTGQTSQNYDVLPVSPEAASLMKMVNYPVNHNTGVPDIRIPLYEIKSGNLNLPVELVYHAGGFKINEQATRSGLGWNLSCELQITRTINGKDDFGSSGYAGNTKIKARQPDNFSDGYRYPLTDNRLNQYLLAVNEEDGMPDKFYYKLLNKSGCFYILKSTTGYTYSFIPEPYEDIKISYQNNIFKIIDTDGTVYYYGGFGSVNSSALEISGTSGAERYTTWKCVRIESPSRRETITFNYSFAYEDFYSQHILESRAQTDCIEYWETTQSYTTPINPTKDTKYKKYEDILRDHPFHTLISPKYMTYYGNRKKDFKVTYNGNNGQLETKTYPANDSSNPHSSVFRFTKLKLTDITFSGGKIVFEGTDHISSIKIYDSKNTQIKNIWLYQSYKAPIDLQKARLYNGNHYNGTNYLDSIGIGNQGNKIERYKFGYYSKDHFGNHLTSSDIWGYKNYYTGEIHDNSMLNIPKILRTTSNQTFNISTSPKDIQAPLYNKYFACGGVLNCIVYPTGGYVHFDYEPNLYDTYISALDGSLQLTPVMAGGLRIKTITHYKDQSAIASQKYYRYGEYEEGTGLINRMVDELYDKDLRYFKPFSYSQEYLYTTDRDATIVNYKKTKTTYLPSSYLDHNYENGAPVYYKKVTEYNMDLGVNTGKTVYRYSDQFEYHTGFSPFSIINGTNISRLRSSWYLGALKSISNYKYEDGKFKLAHKKEFEYTARIMPLWPRVVYSFMGRIRVPLGTYQGGKENLYDCLSGQYGISIGKLLLTKEVEINLDSVRLNKETRYTYGNNTYLQPSRIVRMNSVYQEISSIKYPYDDQHTGVHGEMVSKNMISSVIEKKVESGDTKTTKTNYNKFDGLLLPSSVETSYNGQPYIRELTFNTYDSYGNILEMTGKDGLIKSYIWGYNNRYPIAEIVGKPLSYISASLLNKTIINSPSSDAALKSELNKLYTLPETSMITIMTYKPLVGVTSRTSPQQLTTSYEYDMYSRLINIKDHTGNLLENYTYSIKKTSNAITGPSLSGTSFPIMESYNKICLPNSQIGFANYIERNNQDVWGDLDVAGQSAINRDQNVICTPVAGYAKIKFISMMNQSGRIKIDFIQGDHIIATKRYSYDKMLNPLKETEIYIPAGEYNITFSNEIYNFFGENAFKYVLNNNSVGSSYYISNKGKCNFVGGHAYQITITNIY